MDAQLAESYAKELMAEHDLTDWKFNWSSAVVEFGSCSHRLKEIRLSKPLTELNDEKHVFDTIRHEVAHALAGWEAAHGPAWMIWAIRLGAKPDRCYDSTVVTPPKRWAGSCSTHGVVVERQELGPKMLARDWRCNCGERIVWTDRRLAERI